MKATEDIRTLQELLRKLRGEGKIMLAYLYGSYASNLQNSRSDIDLALYLTADDKKEKDAIVDSILMTSDKQVEILMLDDRDESPFIIQEALKGIPLVEPDLETLYSVAHNALHKAESIRHKRTYPSA